jgi:hypothetical protein
MKLYNLKDKAFHMLPPPLFLRLKWLEYKISQNKEWNRLHMQRTKVSSSGHSFKGMVDTKSIFIHVPKCAGVSISEALYGNLGGGHTTIYEYLYIFSPAEIEQFFKFTFVRNPWDRLLSAYTFLQKGGWGKSDAELFNKELAKFVSFDDFVKNWVNPENVLKHHHVFRPQHCYVVDSKNKVTVDFLGRFENIDNDFTTICDVLG